MDYYSLNNYLKDTFGKKIYKIGIDAGFTCPNRDGTLGNKGCIFCSDKGSGDFTTGSVLSVTEQIELGKERVRVKGPEKFIAYFQAFTNTYAPVETLRKVYMEAVEHKDIVAISIATRPDCLSREVINLLCEINRIKPVWVELGLQTIHEKTAKYIRRGYELPIYDEAVRKLHGINLPVITHVIIGLPGETKEDIIDTVKYVGKVSVKNDGIKLQLLHVLKGTDLEEEYNKGKFSCLTMEEYTDIVVDAIKVLPKDMVIHRITGDGDKRILVAPLWSEDKKRVLNEINRKLKSATD